MLSVKHPATGKVPCAPFFATGVCPWDNMGSMCYRSHDHTMTDKDLAIMRKVNDRREQIRAERKSHGGKGSGSGAGNGKGGRNGKDRDKAKAKPKGQKENDNPLGLEVAPRLGRNHSLPNRKQGRGVRATPRGSPSCPRGPLLKTFQIQIRIALALRRVMSLS